MSKHRKLEPILLEDLVNSPFSQGLESVLRFQPPKIKEFPPSAGAPDPTTDRVDQTPNTGAPVLGAINSGLSNTGALDLRGFHLSPTAITTSANQGAPVLGAPVLGAYKTGAPLLEEGLVYREVAKPRPWVSAQDAHTHGEQNLYQTLFNRGKPIAPNARGLVIGVRTLARLVPMAYSNCHSNLKSLVDKLAIELRPAEKYNDGRFFVIYTYDEILRRRRAAGLTHIMKRTRSVALINPGAPNTGAPDLTEGASNTGAPPFNEGAPALDKSGAPVLGAATIKEFELGTSTPSGTVLSAIINEFGFVDADAVARLIRDCRSRVPDATDEEIAEFASMQCRRIRRMRNVNNPVGLLIDIVPRCFEGEPFARYRRERIEAAQRFEDHIDDEQS